MSGSTGVGNDDLHLGKYEHGKRTTYDKGCRCEQCRAENTRVKRRAKNRNKERLERGEVEIEHGRNGYVNWLCRCAACLEGEYNARVPLSARRVQKKKASEARLYMERRNRTADRAKRQRQQWTGPELEIASRTDLSITEIALLLGRTYSAVVNVRVKLKRDPKSIRVAGIAKGSLGGEQR